MQTIILNNGIEVTSKEYDGRKCARTYANRTQAKQALKKIVVNGWTVYQFGRVFYVGKIFNSK